MIEKIQDIQTIVISGHRGYKTAYPENTLLAFHEAIQRGVDMLEFDLRLSKDQQVVVIHDETVDRTTNATGAVRDFTLAELQQMDAGGWLDPMFAGLQIPTLKQLCDFLQPHPELLFNVEVKPSPDAIQVVDQTMKLLEQYGMLPRCVFTSFDASVLAYMHDEYGVKTQGFIGSIMSNFVEGADGTYSKMWAIGIELKLLSPQTVASFKEMSLQVWSYCPDTEQKVYYSIGCGATVMTCNDPMPALKVRDLLSK